MSALMPEQQGTAPSFYDSREALRYSHQTSQLQEELAVAALQLLDLRAAPQLLLDLGCGSGMSGAVLTDHGHAWVGCDISSDMLALAQGTTASSSMLPDGQLALQPKQQRLKLDSVALPCNTLSLASRTGHNSLNHRPAKHPGRENAAAGRGLVVQSDMAQGIPLRGNSIDGAISISAVQWLCHASEPHKALRRLFRSLHSCLKPERKSVMQVYLTEEDQVTLLLETARAEGFSGGLYVDFPHKGLAKKHFLCLSKGHSSGLEGHIWSQSCPLALPLHCGCTWQWLQKTTKLQSNDHELDVDAHPAKMSMHANLPREKPSHVRAAAISSRHVKQTKRLLRLFRHALEKQSSTTQPDLGVTRSGSAAQSSQTASLSATSARPVPALASAAPAAASESHKPAADGRASAAAPAQSSAALSSESEAHLQTVFLVETSIPWEVANFSACQVPCVFNVSVLPSSVPAQQLQSSEAAAPESLEDQKLAAEEMVAQALKQVFQGCMLHCSTSIKVVSHQLFMQKLKQRSCLKRGAVQVETVQNACEYSEDGSIFAKVLDQSSLPDLATPSESEHIPGPSTKHRSVDWPEVLAGVLQTLPKHPEPWQAALRRPKAKRARASREDTAVLLSMRQFIASRQLHAVITQDNMLNKSESESQPLGAGRCPDGLLEPARRTLATAAAVHQLVIQAAQNGVTAEGLVTRVLQISGFVNHLVFSTKIAKQGVCKGEESTEEGVPDASLLRSALIVQATEASALHAEHDLSVVAVNMRVLTGCAWCDVICFVDRLIP
ncbi:TPA: Williams Beuren syndrome chromosome region 22 protein [Trebouxia sp. C0004]